MITEEVIKYKGSVLAPAGHYYTSSTGNKGITLPYDDNETYTLTKIPKPEIKFSTYILFYSNKLVNVADLDNLKGLFVKFLFGNDDQIAIMLNKDRSEEDAKLYQTMQDWREFFSSYSKKVKSLFDNKDKENS